MKKFIKRNYKGIIVGTVVGALISGVGVYAASNILATNVTYTPSDSSWNVNNTASALDNLYDYYETSKYVETKDCVQGTVICDDRCVGSEGIKVTDFIPSYFTLFFYNPRSQSNEWDIYYKKDSLNNTYYVGTTKEYIQIDDVSLDIKDNSLTLFNWGDDFINVQVDYVACK